MAMKITQQKHTSIRSIHLCQIPKHITVHQATLPRHPSLVDGTAFRRSNDLAAQAGGTHWNDGNTLKITRQAWLETWFHGLKKYLWKKNTWPLPLQFCGVGPNQPIPPGNLKKTMALHYLNHTSLKVATPIWGITLYFLLIGAVISPSFSLFQGHSFPSFTLPKLGERYEKKGWSSDFTAISMVKYIFHTFIHYLSRGKKNHWKSCYHHFQNFQLFWGPLDSQLLAPAGVETRQFTPCRGTETCPNWSCRWPCKPTTLKTYPEKNRIEAAGDHVNQRLSKHTQKKKSP